VVDCVSPLLGVVTVVEEDGSDGVVVVVDEWVLELVELCEPLLTGTVRVGFSTVVSVHPASPIRPRTAAAPIIFIGFNICFSLYCAH